MEYSSKTDEWDFNNPSLEHNPTVKKLTNDPITNTVIQLLIQRSKEGMKEYGVSMQDNPQGVLFWIDSAIEEALDHAQYLQRLRNELVQVYIEPELPL